MFVIALNRMVMENDDDDDDDGNHHIPHQNCCWILSTVNASMIDGPCRRSHCGSKLVATTTGSNQTATVCSAGPSMTYAKSPVSLPL